MTGAPPVWFDFSSGARCGFRTFRAGALFLRIWGIWMGERKTAPGRNGQDGVRAEALLRKGS